jgi:hypothetical protein
MIKKLCFAGIAALLSSAAVLTAHAQTTVGGKPNFNGAWEMLDITKVVRPDQGKPPYTAEASKIVGEFKSWDPKKDDPSLYCDLKGMPWIVLSRARTYPHEIHQTPDRINLFFELFDTSRSIRINEAAPKNLTPSINGYSTARWDNDTLVIKTEALAERLYPSAQLRSEKAEIIERWNLVKDAEHGELIKVDLEVKDPSVYTEVVKGSQVWKRAAEGTTVASYNCPEKLWLKHVEDRRAASKAAK